MGVMGAHDVHLVMFALLKSHFNHHESIPREEKPLGHAHSSHYARARAREQFHALEIPAHRRVRLQVHFVLEPSRFEKQNRAHESAVGLTIC